jgi:ketosteroid isomerase-like protein
VTTPENAIRARRKLTNKLIAGREAARLKPFFAPDVKLIVGDGGLIVGADQVIDAFAAHFAEPGFGAYVRTTGEVRLDASGARAAEHGRWVGTWRDAGAEVRHAGDYLAVWRKAVGQWVIEAEMYVTLERTA